MGRALGRVLIEQGVLTESPAGLRARHPDRPAVRRPLRLRRSTARPSAAVPGAVCRRHSAHADRLRGRQAPGRDGRPGERLRDRRHPLAHRHGRQAGRGDPGRRRRRRSTGTTASTPTSTTSPASSTRRRRRTTSPRSRRSSRTRRSSSSSTCSSRQAIQDRASDIHIEPTEHDLRVRFRIDGVLHEVMRSPKTIQSGVISRLKIMADINIAERRIPQDGRLSVNAARQARSTSASPRCRRCTARRSSCASSTRRTALLDLTDLGLLRRATRALRAELHQAVRDDPGHRARPGSGKSTTLYATLNIVSRPEVNIITVEDPVEYRLPGINQVQINNKAGLTFAAALRSILRSDPDIVLVGEIRDHETGQIAIEAALTGHLVLSTLHTNDAPSRRHPPDRDGHRAVPRRRRALDCVVAQRLARRLCDECKEAYTPDAPSSWRAARFPWQDGEPLPELFRPVGCSALREDRLQGPAAPCTR